jgi:hypothetical protein
MCFEVGEAWVIFGEGMNLVEHEAGFMGTKKWLEWETGDTHGVWFGQDFSWQDTCESLSRSAMSRDRDHGPESGGPLSFRDILETLECIGQNLVVGHRVPFPSPNFDPWFTFQRVDFETSIVAHDHTIGRQVRAVRLGFQDSIFFERVSRLCNIEGDTEICGTFHCQAMGSEEVLNFLQFAWVGGRVDELGHISGYPSWQVNADT